MPQSSAQLLEPGFVPDTQASLWPEDAPVLRYVVKLHQASRLHYDFRLEVYGRLFSLAIRFDRCNWASPITARKVGDHDLKYIFGERRIPEGMTGAGPMLVWDHGIYRTDLGTHDDVYRQLQEGHLEIEMQGIRLNGRFRITSKEKDWTITRLSGTPPEKHFHSVLTGRSLDEIGDPPPASSQPFLLWLEWEHYYADPILAPQVVVEGGYVVDLNFAAKTKGIAVGMRLHHVLPLVPECQVKALSPSSNPWLDHLVPFTDVIQPMSPRCAVIDLSAHPQPADIAARIITKLTSHPCGYLRYGVGPSLWIAQLAALQKNPYGYQLQTKAELALQPIENLLAIAQEDRDRMRALGIETIGAVSKIDPATLRHQFGEFAHTIAVAAQGKNRDRVIPSYPPHTVSHSQYFEAPVSDTQTLDTVIEELAKQLASKIAGNQAGAVLLTAEQEDGIERKRQRVYKRPIHTGEQILASLRYLMGEIQKDCAEVVRLTARLDHLEPIKASQQNLYAATNHVRLDVAITSLKASLGANSVILGSQIEVPRREQVLRAWKNATGWN